MDTPSEQALIYFLSKSIVSHKNICCHHLPLNSIAVFFLLREQAVDHAPRVSSSLLLGRLQIPVDEIHVCSAIMWRQVHSKTVVCRFGDKITLHLVFRTSMLGFSVLRQSFPCSTVNLHIYTYPGVQVPLCIGTFHIHYNMHV